MRRSPSLLYFPPEQDERCALDAVPDEPCFEASCYECESAISFDDSTGSFVVRSWKAAGLFVSRNYFESIRDDVAAHRREKANTAISLKFLPHRSVCRQLLNVTRQVVNGTEERKMA